jgi:ferredoxin
MYLRVMKKEEGYEFLQDLKRDYRVIAPVAENGFFIFKPLEEVKEAVFDYTIAIYPVKNFLLPPYEDYLRFKLGELPQVEVLWEEVPETVLFGMRPCDLNSLSLLDDAFLGDPLDMLYKKRREKFVFIVMDCMAPCDEFSFCKDMGTLNAEKGFDILVTKVKDLYFFKPASNKGASLIQKYGKGKEASSEEESLLKKAYEEREKNFFKKLKMEKNELPQVLWKGYDSPYWEEVAKKCLSCGSCNLVCPTCYCFDVRDKVEINLKEGLRFRTWDGCMLVDFAKVAGGENFRPTTVQRLRHRFLRKGKYLLDRYGKVGCVGCGRCTRHCLVKINPIEVYNGLYNRI